MTDHESSAPEWARRIVRLIAELKVTQAGLAERLGVSPATVSRWIQGKNEPTAEGYVALGNLASKPDGNYFWSRAGVDTSAFPDAALRQAISSLRINLHDFKLVTSQKVSKQLEGRQNAVAIPLLKVSAYGDPIPPRENVNLSEVDVEDVLLAPLGWCPHPEQMVSMHLSGDSMFPTIPPRSILFIDTASTDRDLLHQKIAVVAHRDLGFKVARFQRLSASDLLVSANHKYLPIDVSNASKWKIFGEVLWWVSRDAEPAG